MAQTLKDISARQLLENMLELENAGEEFLSLPPRAQRQLADQLHSEQFPLREAKKNWTTITQKAPRIDTEMFFRDPIGVSEHDDFDETADDTYVQQPDVTRYTDIWRYLVEDGGVMPSTLGDLFFGADDENGDLIEDSLNQETTDINDGSNTVELISWGYQQLFSDSLESELQICLDLETSDAHDPKTTFASDSAFLHHFFCIAYL